MHFTNVVFNPHKSTEYVLLLSSFLHMNKQAQRSEIICLRSYDWKIQGLIPKPASVNNIWTFPSDHTMVLLLPTSAFVDYSVTSFSPLSISPFCCLVFIFLLPFPHIMPNPKKIVYPFLAVSPSFIPPLSVSLFLKYKG